MQSMSKSQMSRAQVGELASKYAGCAPGHLTQNQAQLLIGSGTILKKEFDLLVQKLLKKANFLDLPKFVEGPFTLRISNGPNFGDWYDYLPKHQVDMQTKGLVLSDYKIEWDTLTTLLHGVEIYIFQPTKDIGSYKELLSAMRSFGLTPATPVFLSLFLKKYMDDLDDYLTSFIYAPGQIVKDKMFGVSVSSTRKLKLILIEDFKDMINWEFHRFLCYREIPTSLKQ